MAQWCPKVLVVEVKTSDVTHEVKPILHVCLLRQLMYFEVVSVIYV